MNSISNPGEFARQRRWKRAENRSKEYFLAGGHLRWPMIGLSLFATNISCYHLVGLAENGFTTGLLYGNFEWMAVFTLVLLALFFAPFHLRSRVATLDLSYLEDELTRDEAHAILREHLPTRSSREGILRSGYPGYDTSIGWFNYSDEQIRENVRKSVAAGFTAMKLKVGAPDMDFDLRRTALVREGAGEAATLMVDCNQQWTMPRALEFGERSREFRLFWIEEPTHPDDILGHATLARAYSPHTRVAAGEHVPNRVIFKNYLQANALGFCQVDAVRVAGVSEFLAVTLMAKKRGVPVVPHVGDMGQIHQHLVLFNHIGLGHEALLLEHIPHLHEHFVHPCRVEGGVYRTPQEPGMSSDLK